MIQYFHFEALSAKAERFLFLHSVHCCCFGFTDHTSRYANSIPESAEQRLNGSSTGFSPRPSDGSVKQVNRKNTNKSAHFIQVLKHLVLMRQQDKEWE